MAQEKKYKAQNEIKVSDRELYEASAKTNGYYEGVASVYSTVRYVLLIFLVVFLFASAIRNPESISYDNLMFLMKDLRSVGEASVGDFNNISYNPDTSLSFSGFRKNLAVATTAGLKIYDGEGKLLFEGKERFSNPKIEDSDRYLLMYDFAGNSFALYNSFARIYNEKLEYEITGADISDSGMFAIITRTKEYNSAVLLYTKNCKLKNRFLSEDRVIDASINSKGDRIAILSFDAEDSSFVTKVKISRPGEDHVITSLELRDVFPLSCNFTSDGNLSVFCDKGLYFYDENGNLLGNFVPGDTVEAAKLCDDGVVVALSRNAFTTNSSIIMLNSQGGVEYSGVIEGNASLLDYSEGYVFALGGNVLTRIDIENNVIERKQMSGSGRKMIAYSGSDVMVCTLSMAEYCNFKED